MITKRKLNISRGIKPWIMLLCLSLIVVWACQKEQKIDPGSDPSEKINALSKWYEKQLLPTKDAKSFSGMNNPSWKNTKVAQKGDTIFYTTLVYAKNNITRELQTTYLDGIYNGVVRQYNFASPDSLLTATLTVNGRLIDLGYFDKNKNYTLLSLAGNKNLILMGTETKDGGTLPTPVVTRPWPTDPNNPDPDNPDPDNPPTGTPPTPTFPNNGGPSTSTSTYTVTNHITDPCLKKIVDTLIASNVQNTARIVIMKAFQENQNFNLDFYQSTVLGSEGLATMERYETNPDGSFSKMNVRLDLSLNLLSNASAEYVALVAIHETIHAYLYTKGFFDRYTQKSVDQHDIMWSSYIDVMANYLKDKYGMDINEATVLATDGLQNTFQSKIEDSIYRNLLKKTGPIPSDQRAKIATAYRSGTKGQTCK